MYDKTSMSKKLGWVQTETTVIPTSVDEIIEKAIAGCETSATQIFKIYRFASSPSTDIGRANMNKIYDFVNTYIK